MVCTNKNDAFTVNSGNGNRALTYPIALLTEDEMVLAGGVGGGSSTIYLKSGYTAIWSLSPMQFDANNAQVFRIRDGVIEYNGVDSNYGLRPAISIKPGLPIVNGTGTVLDPYVIK